MQAAWQCWNTIVLKTICEGILKFRIIIHRRHFRSTLKIENKSIKSTWFLFDWQHSTSYCSIVLPGFAAYISYTVESGYMCYYLDNQFFNTLYQTGNRRSRPMQCYFLQRQKESYSLSRLVTKPHEDLPINCFTDLNI